MRTLSKKQAKSPATFSLNGVKVEGPICFCNDEPRSGLRMRILIESSEQEKMERTIQRLAIRRGLLVEDLISSMDFEEFARLIQSKAVSFNVGVEIEGHALVLGCGENNGIQTILEKLALESGQTVAEFSSKLTFAQLLRIAHNDGITIQEVDTLECPFLVRDKILRTAMGELSLESGETIQQVSSRVSHGELVERAREILGDTVGASSIEDPSLGGDSTEDDYAEIVVEAPTEGDFGFLDLIEGYSDGDSESLFFGLSTLTPVGSASSSEKKK